MKVDGSVQVATQMLDAHDARQRQPVEYVAEKFQRQFVEVVAISSGRSRVA